MVLRVWRKLKANDVILDTNGDEDEGISIN